MTSSNRVNDMEKRLEAELSQLIIDIRRVEPCGENYCAYGNLFTDAAVEQYYEALLGTLKAAKRKGLIKFQGQILLKGMHDNVNIYISNGESGNGNGNMPVGDEKKEQEGEMASRSSMMNSTTRSQSARSFSSGYSRTSSNSNLNTNSSQTTAGSTTPTRRFSQNKPTNANANSNDNNQKQQQNRPRSVPPPKSKSRKDIKAAALAMTSAAQKNLSNNRGGGGSGGDIRQKKKTSNNDEPFDEVVATTPTKSKSSRPQQSNTNYSHTPPRDTRKMQRSSSGSSWQSKLSEKLEKNGTNRRSSADVDADTVATAPVQSNDRAYTKKSFKTNESSSGGMYHSSTAGTLSPAMAKISMAESHEERVEREVQQLLLDIQRIEDPNELHCSFGELFCDELVEQYYEALVGTLKAAKKKGLITFKGQMLLKGMSDNVQISIVTE
jgi:hypothetical protein